MQKLPIAERIVDVLAWCSEDPQKWPADLRTDCALIHSRYDALKLDFSTADAWRCAKLEWARSALKQSGMVRVAYHFRDCPQPRPTCR